MDQHNIDSMQQFHFEQSVNKASTISPITNEYNSNFLSVIDRFFTRYYYVHPNQKDEVYSVLYHTNRICLISLGKNHPAIAKGIKSITYNIGNYDRSNNKVKGKGKKGGMQLQPESTLAILTATDDTQYKIPSCIKGKLIEMNERLLKLPELVCEEGSGYIAIVLPKIENCQQIKDSLLSEKQYEEYLKN